MFLTSGASPQPYQALILWIALLCSSSLHALDNTTPAPRLSVTAGETDHADRALAVPALQLTVRGFLQGAYDSQTGLMRDHLRTRGVLAMAQPYTDPNTSLGYNGQETLSPALLETSGNDAPVDWVLVELWDAEDPYNRVHAFAGVLQRDGDVADAQTNNTRFDISNLGEGNYYVALRHRNHLGVMTRTPLLLSSTLTTVDFAMPDTPVYGEHARTRQNNVALMWAGDANNSNNIVGAGPGNDGNTVLGTLLIHPDNTLVNTNYALSGYYLTDLNLDGVTLYSGPGNDFNLIVTNILLHPVNTTFAANYILQGGMP